MEQRNVIFKGGKTGITSIEWLVFVDEQNIGKVNFSKDLSVNLNVGKHRIQYVWGVYKTNVLEINIIINTKHITYECTSVFSNVYAYIIYKIEKLKLKIKGE